MSAESLELSSLRRDTFAREAFLAGTRETPKDHDSSDGWPVRVCVCCAMRKPLRPTWSMCEECIEGGGE